MRLEKYVVSVVLISLVFIFIGEVHTWYLHEFEKNYEYVTFYLQKDTTPEEMIGDIHAGALANQIEVFVVDRTIESSISEKISIYGTEGAEQYLNENSSVRQGLFHSILLGKTDLEVKDFKEIPDISRIRRFQVIGEEENIVNFKRELVNQYAGAFPRKDGGASGDRQDIAMVWCLVFLLLLLLTLYDAAILKKEAVVRMVSGESSARFALRNMALDIAFFSILFVAAAVGTSRFTNSLFCFETSAVLLAGFLVMNSVVYVQLMVVDYKSDITMRKNAKKLIGISYVYQILTVFITITIMAGCINLIDEGIHFYQQKEFFLKHNLYSYYTITSLDEEQEGQAELLRNNLYQMYLKKGDGLTLTDLGADDKGNAYIMADSGAIEYLVSEIPELRDKKFEEKVYFIIPDALDAVKDLANGNQVWRQMFSIYYNSEYDFETMTYQNNVSLISQNGVDGVSSSLRKNPILILNNIASEDLNLKRYGYILQAAMLKISDAEWDNYFYENNFEDEIVYKTNVYENYLFHWTRLKREMIIGLAVFFLLLVLESVIVYQVLKFEYSVNAIPLLLKKINGCSLWGTHKKILAVAVGCGLLGIAISLGLNRYLGSAPPAFLVMGGGAVLLLELSVIVGAIIRFEKIHMQRVLKGGIL